MEKKHILVPRLVIHLVKLCQCKGYFFLLAFAGRTRSFRDLLRGLGMHRVSLHAEFLKDPRRY